MSPTICPHGLAPARCEICRVLEPTPVAGRAPIPPWRRRPGLPGVTTMVVAVVVGVVVLGWVAAAVFAVLRILELVAVAFLAAWVGFRLGVRKGRSG